jgi:hypothetical protein
LEKDVKTVWGVADFFDVPATAKSARQSEEPAQSGCLFLAVSFVSRQNYLSIIQDV